MSSQAAQCVVVVACSPAQEPALTPRAPRRRQASELLYSVPGTRQLGESEFETACCLQDGAPVVLRVCVPRGGGCVDGGPSGGVGGGRPPAATWLAALRPCGWLVAHPLTSLSRAHPSRFVVSAAAARCRTASPRSRPS